MSDLENIVTKFNVISEKIEKDVATKNEVAELRDLVKALGKEQDRAYLKQRSNRVFGDEAVAREFVDYLAKGIQSGVKSNIARSEEITKAAFNAEGGTANLGSNVIPTSVQPVFTQLLSVGAKARQFHDVLTLNGPMDLPYGDDEVSVAFTDDVTALTEVNNTLKKVNLNPKQLGALYVSSEKILLQSAVPIAEIVATNLVNAAGVFEDTKVLLAANGGTDGGITGYNAHASVPSATVASLSAMTYTDLLDRTTAVHESIVDGEWYMPRETIAQCRKLKDSQNRPLIDIQGQDFYLFGAKVNRWDRIGNPDSASELVALYGNLRKAGTIGVGREMGIQVSDQFLFNKVQLAWRLVYDFSFVIRHPNAVARLKIAAS